MTKSREELVNDALTRLGALPAGQTAAPEDYAYVDGQVEPVISDLALRNVTVSQEDDIDDANFLHIAAVLAFHCRGWFGVVGQEATDLRNDALLAERNLKFINRATTQNQPVKAVYY
jgi:hypothetical protein